MQQRRARPAGRATQAPRRPTPTPETSKPQSQDLRRTLAAAASAILPGIGQLINGRRRLARWFLLPMLLVLGVFVVVVASKSPARLFATMVAPTTMWFLLVLNVIVLCWRVVAVAHAFFDGRYPARSRPAALAGLAIVLAVVVIPHGILNAWGTSAQAAFARVFTTPPPGASAADVDRPGLEDRVNILLVGIDKTPGRTSTLTDSLMVVSVDPVGETVTMVSLPRDLVRVPLGNGELFAPKVNALMAYADRQPQKFPQGGMRALEDAIGALLGIRIDYYVRIDFFGFVKLVDAVGGVDVDVKRAFYDSQYDGMGINIWPIQGWGVTVGLHHFNGWEALAYARARHAAGESDFTRAARQQEILLALRTKVMADGSMLANLPTFLDAFQQLVQTDIPTDSLPALAAVADELPSTSIVRTVLKRPLIKGGTDPVYGSIQIPDVKAIQAVALTLFPPPGTAPQPWPSPVPTAPVRSSTTPG